MVITIEIYGKSICAKCETTKNKVDHWMQKWGLEEKVAVKFWDMSTPDGMAEGAFYDVSYIPTTIIRSGRDVVERWDGVVPGTQEFKEEMMGVFV